ncbi:hypothetical protein F183_A45670 [Bryobacterales bacterium F-183]|nr:hypothetical protein F183_A45670 [Bryobacterales bacterium F-183]
MSLWTRIRNVFRGERVNADLDEEMRSHLDEAVANGRTPSEAGRAFGSVLLHREEMRDHKVASWLDSLRADAVFGLRQLNKNRTVSAAAILSLGLAIGACTGAFRLADAILWRPLPIAQPERLHVIEYQVWDRNTREPDIGDSFSYPHYRHLQAAAKDHARLLAISYASPVDITYGSDQDMERAVRQWVCGEMFGAFGLRPALGRLLTEAEEKTPKGHPYVVLSYGYWSRRFGQDPNVLGKRLRLGLMSLEIIGVAPKGFSGTEPGLPTDLFIPNMMNHEAIHNPNWHWFRTYAMLRQGADRSRAASVIHAAYASYQKEHIKTWTNATAQQKQDEITRPVYLEPSPSGVSSMQRRYGRALLILGAVVILVLLIACANVANLMSAQSAARAKEMSLRVSIGAGRRRLMQLMLVESAWIALFATAVGAVIAWWSAPFVASSISHPRFPSRIDMPLDWRVIGFGSLLGVLVTSLFGIVPAIRAARVQPMTVLRGGEDPHGKRRFIQALTALQTGFCFVVLFVAGLFLSTFDQLAKQPTGFRSQGVLLLETGAKKGLPAVSWTQVLDRLGENPQVEAAALSAWNPMAGSMRGSQIWLNGEREPQAKSPYVLGVSGKWLETMRLPLIGGRDFTPKDSITTAIVTQAFAKQYFGGENPVGRYFEQMDRDGKRYRVDIVGLAADFKYADMRDVMRPVVLLPFPADVGPNLNAFGTFVVRTRDGIAPLQLATPLRKAVMELRPELRVSDVTTQEELVEQQLVRERLLAAMSLFFAVVALVLAGVGLYGVITYSMLQRRKEIGIRMALGAQAVDVARRVTLESFTMLGLGCLLGLTGGFACSTLVESLLFAVKPRDPQLLLVAALVLAATAVAAAIPPVIRAVRIDPANLLRSE